MPDSSSPQTPRGETAFISHPDYEMDIGAHVFPTQKFRLIREELIRRGTVAPELILEAPMPSDADLLRVMDREYFDDFSQLRRTARTLRSELPLTAEIVRGCKLCAGGSILGARLAMTSAAGAVHIGGGFHHAFRDHGEGFCYINDPAAAALAVLEEGLCERVAIVDTDVHQGNGTAGIFRHDPRVFAFSIHQENNYPIPKQKSSLDIGLDDGVRGPQYLARLRGALDQIFGEFKPQFMVYVGGVDPYKEDVLGGLLLTIDDMRRRDEMCLMAAAEAGVPFLTTTAGGYARDVRDTVTMHANTAEVAIEAGKVLRERCA